METTFPIISILLLIIGITMLLIAVYYNLILKKLLKTLATLLELQSNTNEGVEERIQTIKSHLKKIGVYGISYNIVYLKKRIFHSEPHPKLIEIKKDIYYPNIQGYFTIYVTKNRGEYYLLNKLILYVITLQIVQSIHAEIDKINESFHRIEKLQTYIIHDLRNVLQYFQAMQYNVEHLQNDEDEKRFLAFLKESAKPVNEKVNNLLSLLKIDISQEEKEKETINIKELLEEIINFFKFPCKIEGNATITTYKNNLRTVFNNILANIYDKSFYEKNLLSTIKIEEDEEEVCIIVTDNGKPFENPLAVCQPFYSTKEEAIGIGMYQALRLVEGLGGSLKCYNKEQKATIELKIPKV